MLSSSAATSAETISTDFLEPVELKRVSLWSYQNRCTASMYLDEGYFEVEIGMRLVEVNRSPLGQLQLVPAQINTSSFA